MKICRRCGLTHWEIGLYCKDCITKMEFDRRLKLRDAEYKRQLRLQKLCR